ncbi:ATP synthase F1 subunit delta [Roseococcus sp. DSY-14]|uniref:ATP synthase F1 subunit delta n=1 Tax=Roseococcus sp. DSY-14 TaxID=3369650 RepID=UPI00387B3CE6
MAETISQDTPVATRYALALLARADELRAADPGALDAIAAGLDQLARMAAEGGAFAAFLNDPRLSAKDQQAALLALADKAGVHPQVRNFLGVLVNNRRLSSLPAVAAAFGAKLAERRGTQVAHVTSAFPLSDVQRAQIVARLTESGYSGVQLNETVDRSILGGLIVRIGSRLYDNSIKSKLQRLQYAMKGAA